MEEAFPEALVDGHDPLIAALDLPDPDDRHVLAAAIRAGAQLIVTENLRDFPRSGWRRSDRGTIGRCLPRRHVRALSHAGDLGAQAHACRIPPFHR
jgi:hypothetical protein